MKEQSGENRQVRVKRQSLNLIYWSAGWALSLMVMAFGPKNIWDFNPTISTIFIFLSTLIGVGMILANKRHINGLDEMQRKVILESMAVALGVGVVGGISYSMLDQANVVSFDAKISHLVILISLTYIVGVVVGNLRYR